jgi:hypothetical protein
MSGSGGSGAKPTSTTTWTDAANRSDCTETAAFADRTLAGADWWPECRGSHRLGDEVHPKEEKLSRVSGPIIWERVRRVQCAPILLRGEKRRRIHQI